jgi:transcription-repair coupling factor (superfamily II helicase)
LPPQAKNLFRIAELKLAAKELGLRKMDIGPGGGSVTFESDTRVDPGVLIRYVQQNARTHRLEGGVKLRFTLKLETEERRFETAQQLIDALGSKPPPAAPAKRK